MLPTFTVSQFFVLVISGHIVGKSGSRAVGHLGQEAHKLVLLIERQGTLVVGDAVITGLCSANHGHEVVVGMQACKHRAGHHAGRIDITLPVCSDNESAQPVLISTLIQLVLKLRIDFGQQKGCRPTHHRVSRWIGALFAQRGCRLTTEKLVIEPVKWALTVIVSLSCTTCLADVVDGRVEHVAD